MSGLWEEMLQPARLAGVELPIERRRISGGRDVARKSLPYVSGQETEDTGRKPRIIEADIALFSDMQEDDLYPERYEALISVLQDDTEQSSVVWDDPVWGAINVKVMSWDADETAEDRDGVRISLTMEEDGFLDSEDLQISLLGISDQGRAETDAAELDAQLSDAGISDADIDDAWEAAGFPREPSETTSFADGISNLSRSLNAGAQTAQTAKASVNRIQARLQAAMAIPAARVASAWSVLDLGMRLVDASAAMGAEVIAKQARQIEYTTTSRMSVFEIANELYGDPSRVDEILRANPQQHPLFIPAGVVLSVLET